MKRINLLIVSIIVAVILFGILTFIQRKIVNPESFQKVFVVSKNISKDEEILKSSIKEVNVPISLVAGTDTIINESELVEKYAKSEITKGKILFKQDIATKSELRIIDNLENLECISFSINSAENAVSYQIRPKDSIHLYFTGRTNLIKDTFSRYGLPLSNVQNENSMQTVKLIENVKILGIYDEMGISYGEDKFSRPDTIVIGVDSKYAEIINNLRDQGVFDITR